MIDQEETRLVEETKDPNYEKRLKEKYNLTDEQIKEMREKGMNDSQITIAAQLAKTSEQPVEKVVDMRINQKIGWGRIAQDLGVHPSEIGRGVSEMRRKDVENSRVKERKTSVKERKSKREVQKMQRKQKKTS